MASPSEPATPCRYNRYFMCLRLVMRDYYYRYSIAVKDNEEDNSAY